MNNIHGNFPLPKIISFYTRKTLYELEVKRLLASCNQFQLDHEVDGIDSFGSWEVNCAYKPFFILEKLKSLQSPVLWVDADAVFLKKLEHDKIFEADTAIYEESNLAKGFAEGVVRSHPSQVRSGTLFFNYTPGAFSLLRAWAEECQKQLLDPNREDEFWDQKALQVVLHQGIEPSIKIANLPLKYIHIYDHPGDCEKEKNPVISHYQASRQAKFYAQLNIF